LLHEIIDFKREAELKVQQVWGLQPPPLDPECDPPEEENPGSFE
jgi:hypothetical protein